MAGGLFVLEEILRNPLRILELRRFFPELKDLFSANTEVQEYLRSNAQFLPFLSKYGGSLELLGDNWVGDYFRENTEELVRFLTEKSLGVARDYPQWLQEYFTKNPKDLAKTTRYGYELNGAAWALKALEDEEALSILLKRVPLEDLPEELQEYLLDHSELWVKFSHLEDFYEIDEKKLTSEAKRRVLELSSLVNIDLETPGWIVDLFTHGDDFSSKVEEDLEELNTHEFPTKVFTKILKDEHLTNVLVKNLRLGSFFYYPKVVQDYILRYPEKLDKKKNLKLNYSTAIRVVPKDVLLRLLKSPHIREILLESWESELLELDPEFSALLLTPEVLAGNLKEAYYDVDELNQAVEKNSGVVFEILNKMSDSLEFIKNTMDNDDFEYKFNPKMLEYIESLPNWVERLLTSIKYFRHFDSEWLKVRLRDKGPSWFKIRINDEEDKYWLPNWSGLEIGENFFDIPRIDSLDGKERVYTIETAPELYSLYRKMVSKGIKEFKEQELKELGYLDYSSVKRLLKEGNPENTKKLIQKRKELSGLSKKELGIALGRFRKTLVYTLSREFLKKHLNSESFEVKTEKPKDRGGEELVKSEGMQRAIKEFRNNVLNRSKVKHINWTGMQRAFKGVVNHVFLLTLDKKYISEELRALSIEDTHTRDEIFRVKEEHEIPESVLKESAIDHHLEDGGGHPYIQGKLTIGWVRYTLVKDITGDTSDDRIWIDEIQSDFSNGAIFGKSLSGYIFPSTTASMLTMKQFIKFARSKGYGELLLPNYHMADTLYKRGNPPKSLYTTLPTKLHFKKEKIDGIDPRVNNKVVWVHASKELRLRKSMLYLASRLSS